MAPSLTHFRFLAQAGIGTARERIGSPFGARTGVYNWDGGTGKMDTLRKIYAANGVSVLEIVGRANAGPRFGMGTGQTYPLNLPEVASEWSGVARHFDSVWAGAEVDNEPDLRSVPADQYVPLVKALSYALRKGESHAPLVAGALATAPPGPFFDTCAANGMLADCDAISFHAYDAAPDIGPLVARYREWLKNANAKAMPLWLSECGKPWKNGPGRPPRDQDALSACEIAAMAVEARAAGVPTLTPVHPTERKNEGVSCSSCRRSF